MKRIQKFHVWFWLNHRRQKEGQSTLYYRIIIDGQRAEGATTHFVKKEHWSETQGRLKNNAPHNIQINGFIDFTKNEMKKLFLELSADGRETCATELKNKFLGKDKVEEKPKEKTICEAFDYHNLKMSEIVKIGKVSAKTLLRFKITKDKVIAFMENTYKISDQALPEMRLRFVTEFEHFLLTVQGIQSNTAHKYIKNLKKIMNMAVGLDWIAHNPFNQFKCSYSSPEREILNQEELFKIYNKEGLLPRLIEVRDVFVFCCYTGFAYTDVYQFERDAVMKGLDGELWLSTNRQKTGTKESVPLLPIALEIIQKYQNHPYCVKHNKLLPVNSNQRYNSYLKELADVCEISKTLTSHIARHTFATTVTLANGVPIETVSSMLGHNSIRTTQIYAKVVEKKVSEDMQLLRAKLFGIVPQQQELKIG